MGTAPNDPTNSAASLQIDAFLGMLAKLDNLTLTASYSPRMVETPPPQGSGLAVVHAGRLGLEYRTSSTGHILLQQLGSFGRNDYSPLVSSTPLSGPAAPRITDPRLPTKALLSIVDSDSSISGEQALSRRFKIHGTLGYVLSGGADSIAQQYIPLMRGGRGSAGADWLATPSDRLNLGISGWYSKFTNGSRATLTTITAGWDHAIGANTRSDVGIGSAMGESSGPTAGGSPTPYPWVAAGIAHTIPMRGQSVSGSLRLSATPQVDRTNGDVYELASGSASLGWSLERVLRLAASGSFGRALSGIQQVGTQLVTAEGSASVPAGLATFSVGVRGFWQSVPPPAPGTLAVPGFQWAVFGQFVFGVHGTP